MKRLLRILGPAIRVAGTAATVVNPALAPVLGVINAALPDGRKLAEDATGRQIVEAYEGIEDKEAIDRRLDEMELELQHATDNLSLMVAAEKAGAGTRPFIAALMAWTVALQVFGVIGILLVAVARQDHESLDMMGRAWPLVMATVATPTVLLRSYFGLRTAEKKSRYAAATGQNPGAAGLAGAVTGLVSAIRGK